MITALPPKPIEQIEYVMSRPIGFGSESVGCFNYMDYLATSPIQSIKNKICQLSRLESNWDGFGSNAPSEKIIKNTYKFIDASCAIYRDFLKQEDVTLTPYGTVVLDFQSTKGLVSVEIGETKIGFFTDFSNGRNHHSNGLKSSFRIVPSRLKKNLERL